jgi:hypothetical protein
MRPSRVTRAMNSAPSVIDVAMTSAAFSVARKRDVNTYSTNRTSTVETSSTRNSLTSGRGSNSSEAPTIMNRPNATSSHHDAIAPTSIIG